MAEGNDLQNTEQWDLDRLGKITSSEMKAVMSKGRGTAPSETAATYMAKIVASRLMDPKVRLASMNELSGIKALDHGNKTEELAIGRFEWENSVAVIPTGFITHAAFPYVGGSPDGLTEDSGLEIKCPHNPDIHMKTLINNVCPKDHVHQVQSHMWITGKMKFWFISYCPSLPAPYDYFQIEVERDNAFIAKMEEACIAFEKKVQQTILELNERFQDVRI